MLQKSILKYVTGVDIAVELNSYGLDVVGCATRTFPQDKIFYQRFINEFKVERSTPKLRMPEDAILYKGFNPQSFRDIPEIVGITNWRFFPGSGFEPEAAHETMLRRLLDGKPVTLIQKTAKAFRTDAEQLRLAGFNSSELRMLNWTVQQQRKPGATPVSIVAAFAEGKLLRQPWVPSLTRRRVAHCFVALNHHLLRWTNDL